MQGTTLSLVSTSVGVQNASPCIQGFLKENGWMQNYGKQLNRRRATGALIVGVVALVENIVRETYQMIFKD